jgi:hypothetical protein
MKVALCFIISYEHILNKEELWKEWIEPNKDIINVYFYYKDFQKIESEWIKKHCIPPSFIHETSYFYVIPAYVSLMKFALKQDSINQWFCILTDSCCPIISPKRFRYLFYTYFNKSILSWKKAWWNTQFHKRANLALLPEELRLANDPWFVMKRENVLQTLQFANNQQKITSTVCSGGLANESLFAIILYAYKQLNDTICAVSHTTDWSRRTSPTSPHLFKEANELDIKFIDNSLEKDKYVMFIRKIAPEFPDEILRYYIYEHSKKNDEKLNLREPLIFIYSRYKMYFFYGLPIFIFLYALKYLLL